MDNIVYISGDDNLLDDIKDLWGLLNDHHMLKSYYFTENLWEFYQQVLYQQ